MKRFLIHNPTQSKVGDQQIGVILGCPEKQIFRLQVSMDDAMVVQVCYSAEGGSDQVCGIGFVVTAFPAYTVEEFAAESEVCDEVDYGMLEVLPSNRQGPK